MRRVLIIALSFLTTFSLSSNAATVWIYGANVKMTLMADDGRWGGCMAQIDKVLIDEGLDCPGSWISFSCNGVYNTKDIAFRMFDTAQLAFALGHRISLSVDDTKKHNGYCYANRLDLFR